MPKEEKGLVARSTFKITQPAFSASTTGSWTLVYPLKWLWLLRTEKLKRMGKGKTLAELSLCRKLQQSSEGVRCVKHKECMNVEPSS